jgi:uncharacterized protein
MYNLAEWVFERSTGPGIRRTRSLALRPERGALIRLTIAAIVLSSLSGAASAQTFDCRKAQTQVEKMICADAGLSALDEHLGRYYAAGRTQLESAGSCLQADQAQWVNSTRDLCQNNACLTTAYLNRLGELDALQPGATAIRNISFPRVPSLAWVIAPASDKVAAPPVPNVRPLEATGVIVDDVSNGDGFVLRTTNGTNVPLLLLMFMEGTTPQQLAGLARETGVTFRARGYSGPDGKGTYFEPSRCTFIHRMPSAAAGTPNAGDQDQEQQIEKIQQTVLTQGAVCPDPRRPCDGFKPNELSFEIAKPFAFDRGRDKSLPFYAVILKSGPLCSINDSERLQAQKQFAGMKVFLHRHFCEDFGDKVTYSNVNASSGFVAVYAGKTEADAKRILAQAITAGYKDANLRRMEVIVVYQLE